MEEAKDSEGNEGNVLTLKREPSSYTKAMSKSLALEIDYLCKIERALSYNV